MMAKRKQPAMRRRVMTKKERDAQALKAALAEEGIEDEAPADAVPHDGGLLEFAAQAPQPHREKRHRTPAPEPHLIPYGTEEARCCVVYDHQHDQWRTAWLVGLAKTVFGDPFTNAVLACRASMAINQERDAR